MNETDIELEDVRSFYPELSMIGRHYLVRNPLY